MYVIEFSRVQVNFGQKSFAFDVKARYGSPPHASFCLHAVFGSTLLFFFSWFLFSATVLVDYLG